jgi:hypothetical protein
VALDSRTFRELPGKSPSRRGREQRLAAAGECHDTGRERHGKAFDLGADRATGDVLGRILAEGDRPYMKAYAGGERKFGKRMMVIEGVAGCVRGVVEEHEEAIGASDLAAMVPSNQVAAAAVVRSPDLRGPRVSEPLNQTRAVDDVGKKESPFGHAG